MGNVWVTILSLVFRNEGGLMRIIPYFLSLCTFACQTWQAPPVPVPAPVAGSYGIENMKLAIDTGARVLVLGIESARGGLMTIFLEARDLYKIVDNLGGIDYTKLKAEFYDLDMLEKAKLATTFIEGLADAFGN